MSDHIPYEIQVQVIKRLPVKSLIRFRSVSKAWKALIDNSDFIDDYSLRQADQPQRHLVSYNDSLQTRVIPFVDDESFPQPILTPALPLFVMRIIGSSRGLLCLYGYWPWPMYNKVMAVLWNPSIQRSVGIVVPNVFTGMYETILGFGVCPHTNDPKILKFRQTSNLWHIESPQELEVFTLSSGVWRSLCSNLPGAKIEVTSSQVAIDGSIYWIALDRKILDGRFWRSYNLILSFDLASEEFREVGLSDSLALRPPLSLSISRLRESLAVLEYSRYTGKQVCGVWMMERGVPNSFTKLFVVEAPHASINKVLGFRKSGECMVEVQDEIEELATLFVYEPNSQQINDLEILGCDHSFFMSSYMETLLLLDHANGSIIDI